MTIHALQSPDSYSTPFQKIGKIVHFPEICNFKLPRSLKLPSYHCNRKWSFASINEKFERFLYAETLNSFYLTLLYTCLPKKDQNLRDKKLKTFSTFCAIITSQFKLEQCFTFPFCSFTSKAIWKLQGIGATNLRVVLAVFVLKVWIFGVFWAVHSYSTYKNMLDFHLPLLSTYIKGMFTAWNVIYILQVAALRRSLKLHFTNIIFISSLPLSIVALPPCFAVLPTFYTSLHDLHVLW